MRHSNKNRKFGRTKNQRNAFMNGLVYSLVKYKRIVTTEAKAKELRPQVEKLVTKSKTSDLHTKRVIQSQTGSFDVAKELEKKLVSMMSERTNQDAGIFVRETVVSNPIISNPIISNPISSVKQPETTTSTYTSSYDLYRKKKQFS